jgi:hypothetical protein
MRDKICMFLGNVSVGSTRVVSVGYLRSIHTCSTLYVDTRIAFHLLVSVGRVTIARVLSVSATLQQSCCVCLFLVDLGRS